jgi:hypothetical protein
MPRLMTRAVGQPLLYPVNRSYLNHNFLMLKSRHAASPLSIAFLSITVLTLLSAAFAQDFALVASPVSPAAVFPGGQSATSTINVSALNFPNPVNVDLSCQVTPLQTTGTPTCVISPASVTTPANPSLTITTGSTTPATLYTVTVTGTITGTTTTHPVMVNLTVLSAIPEYTLTITSALTPTSVHAGSAATAVLTVTPINGYTGTISLSCSAITPTATRAPTCAFNPASIALTTSTAQTSTLTISTTGPHATAISRRSIFYGLWLPLPGLALIAIGFGTPKKRRKRVLCTSLLCAMAAVLAFLSACNTTSSGTSTTGTPNNGYTFTISAADANALAPSNGTQSVILTVN